MLALLGFHQKTKQRCWERYIESDPELGDAEVDFGGGKLSGAFRREQQIVVLARKS